MTNISNLSLFITQNLKNISHESVETLELKISYPFDEYYGIFKETFAGKAISYNYAILGNENYYYQTKEAVDEAAQLLSDSNEKESKIIQVVIKINKREILNEIKDIHLKNGYLFATIKSFENRVNKVLDYKASPHSIEDHQSKINLILFSGFEESIFSDYINIVNIENVHVLKNTVITSLSSASSDKIKNAKDLYVNFLSKNISTFLDFPYFWGLDYTSNETKRIALRNFFRLISNREMRDMTFKIKGVQSLVLDFSDETDFNEVNIDKLSKIIDFTVDDKERFLDKILIIRNVLTVYFSNDTKLSSVCERLDEIISTIEYNFELYVQEKIQVFLDQKNKLISEAIDVSKKIAKLTFQLISSMRTLLISLLGTVFISFVSALGDQLNKPLLLFSIISYALYFLGLLYTTLNSSKEVTINENILKNYIKEIGNDNVSGLSFEELNEKYLKESIEEFDDALFKFRILLIFLILFFVILYISLRFNVNLFWLKSLIKFILGMP